MKVKQILRDAANRFAKKPAIIFRGKEVSFAELNEKALRLAKGLQQSGVQKGDKVAIYLPNCPENVYSYLAVFCLGAVGVPLDYMLKSDELISCLSHSETKFLIAKKNDISLTDIKRAVSSLEKIVLCDDEAGEFLSFEKVMSGAAPDISDVQIDEKDPALIMYTSGTTGRPKGILLNYRHLNGSPEAMKYFVDLSGKDVKICALPLSHIGGFIYIQNCILFGITLILMDRFNPFEFLKNVHEYRVSCFHIVPPMYAALLSLKEIERFDLTSLRWIVVFGAPSSPEMLKRFHQFCPNARFLNGWGMTETCPPNTVTPLDSTKIESVGKPAPNCEIKIFNEENKEVPAGEIGEIVIRGWVVMDGYYKDSEANESLIQDGWFHTGDLGRFDREGFLYIAGRKKEMIKVGGQIVYAPEVEAALQKHERVLEAAVIGVPDKLSGEAVKAFVVLREKGSIDADQLRYFAREHLAHFKIPQAIEIRESLPKNRTGKIDKELLKQEMVAI